jgi:hypothetical protein
MTTTGVSKRTYFESKVHLREVTCSHPVLHRKSESHLDEPVHVG